MTVIWILVLTVGLAAANGANDVSRGVATLAGAGVTRYRTAILWGAATTLVGALLAIPLGRAMTKLFSSGIIEGRPTGIFALSVLTAAAAWVAITAWTRLPVSTTHSLVGGLIGAALVWAPGSIAWGGVAQKVVTPLLVSIVVAFGIMFVLTQVVGLAKRIASRQRERGQAPGQAGPSATPRPGAAGGATVAVEQAVAIDERAMRSGRVVSVLHWISSGATGAARGLNDTPKIAAVSAFALLPAGYSINQIILMVAFAMGLGSLLGVRVARTLGEKVVRMGHGEGFQANAVTSVLVGFGGTFGLPMSTTHVSTGSIAGIASGDFGRLNKRTLRDILLAWTVTPAVTGLIAAGLFALLNR